MMIDQIYSSYLNASKYFGDKQKDSELRSPELLEPLFFLLQNGCNIIVTGSKGKGSLARMIAALLSDHGRTGLFISPHVSDFRERISINGCMITENELEEELKYVFSKIKKTREALPEGRYISPVGITAAAALRYFKKNNTVWNVLECGRGARYDDVNRIKHDYAVIGTVFCEHQSQLGDTIEEIAEDKAHVITDEVKCAYVCEQDAAVMDIIRERAAKKGTVLKCYGKDFYAYNIRQDEYGLFTDIRTGDSVYRNIGLSMYGQYQAKHAALALTIYNDIVDGAKKSSVGKLSEVRINGRMEIIRKKPFVLLDSCINRISAAEIVELWRSLGLDKAVVIMALPDSKDVAGVAEVINEAAGRIILTRIEHPHYPMKTDQKKILEKKGIPCDFENNFKNAFKTAKSTGEPIFILVANTFVHYVKNCIIPDDYFI